MEIAALIVLGLGVLLSLVGGIWFLIVAFSESVLWGLGCLFLPIVGLIFLCLNFGDTWRPAALSLLGSCLMLGSAFMVSSP